MKNLILGSGSPRRKELLSELGFDFVVRVKEIDETCPDSIPVMDRAIYAAKKKAEALQDSLEKDDILICADTVVILNGKTLNKPANATEAFAMLKSLSGNKHQVCTGVVLLSNDKFNEINVVTEVEFNLIPDEAIQHYIVVKKPFDKAGSYGIQEWIGHAFVKGISGSYNNVVGLPTSDIYPLLKELMA